MLPTLLLPESTVVKFSSVIQELFQNVLRRSVESKRENVIQSFTNSAHPKYYQDYKLGWMRWAKQTNV
jgi:hypothetical protein